MFLGLTNPVGNFGIGPGIFHGIYARKWSPQNDRNKLLNSNNFGLWYLKHMLELHLSSFMSIYSRVHGITSYKYIYMHWTYKMSCIGTCYNYIVYKYTVYIIHVI